jgi:hypothetical protein
MLFHQDDPFVRRSNDQAGIAYVQDEANQACFTVELGEPFDGHAFAVVDAVTKLEVTEDSVLKGMQEDMIARLNEVIPAGVTTSKLDVKPILVKKVPRNRIELLTRILH